MKTLVVYFSRTNRTRFVAEKIAKHLETDTEEVKESQTKKGMMTFMKASLAAMLSRETEIAEPSKIISQYDLIIIGTPVWYTRPVPAITTYLKKIKLTGKSVAFFCTNEGSGAETTFKKLKELTTGSIIVGTLAISNVSQEPAEAEAKVSEWCSKLKAA